MADLAWRFSFFEFSIIVSPIFSKAMLLLIVALTMSLASAWFTSVKPVCADMTAQWGASLLTFERPAQSVDAYRLAVVERPSAGVYQHLLADALQKLVQESASESYNDLMSEAEATLLDSEKQGAGLNASSFRRIARNRSAPECVTT